MTSEKDHLVPNSDLERKIKEAVISQFPLAMVGDIELGSWYHSHCMKIVLDNHGRIELFEHCQGNENYARRFEIELFCNGKSVSSAGYLTSDVAMYEEKVVKQIEEMIATYYFLCVDEKTKLDWE